MKYCISNCQHVFQTKHSVTTNNLIFQLGIFNCIIERNQLNCTYTNFIKTFDRINYKLLFKLKCYGVQSIFLKLIEFYLYCRIKLVKLLNTLSNGFIAHSGVPQG